MVIRESLKNILPTANSSDLLDVPLSGTTSSVFAIFARKEVP
ncbi:MAG: hypothetical protein UV80_C0010G0012 [Candidatus Peregrinibacteria bacterium GW2011_GWF2_43_17]|nr:MAG: hypothetical protein UV80_C0010G0012 [Candidatus Peregrinibacteria bacterium GW2011_GWF2_43_17]